MAVFDSSSNPSCPSQPSLNTDAAPFASGHTLHQYFKWISAACTGVTTILCIFLILMHLGHYTMPDEQRQIIRMVFAPVVFSLLSLGSIFYYPAAIDLDSVSDVYESVALCGLFLLFVNIVAPEEWNRDKYFYNLQLRDKKGKPKAGGSLKWFNRIWVSVFQLPLTRFILMIATIATEADGKYCPTSNSVHYAHVWIRVLSIAAVALAIGAILRFYGREKPTLKGHSALSKLVVFKAIVFLNAIQTMVFSFLQSGGDLNATTHASYGDWAYGLPAFIFTGECVIFACAFQYVYRASEYKAKGPVQMGFLGAIFDALNPLDMLKAFLRIPAAFGVCCGGARSKHLDEGTTYAHATDLQPVGGYGYGQQPVPPQYGENLSSQRLAPSVSPDSRVQYYPREQV